MSRKAQAALEFLTTYGWAFLVILIMIGTLAYFGILKPSRILPDRCSIGPEFECIDFQLSKTENAIKFRLKNNVGEAINIESITASTETASALSCSGSPPISGIWAGADIRDFSFTGCNSDAIGFVIGEKVKVLVNIKYYAIKSGSNYAHTVNGELFSTVV